MAKSKAVKMTNVAPMLAAVMNGKGSATKAPSPKQLVKEHAKHAARRATEDWVEGRISTKEHNAVHARAKHVMSGKQVREFKGKTGERRPANHATNGY